MQKIRPLTLIAALFLTATVAQGQIELHQEHTFDARPGQTVVIDVSFHRVEVNVQPGATVHAVVDISASGSSGKAERAIEELILLCLKKWHRALRAVNGVTWPQPRWGIQAPRPLLVSSVLRREPRYLRLAGHARVWAQRRVGMTTQVIASAVPTTPVSCDLYPDALGSTSLSPSRTPPFLPRLSEKPPPSHPTETGHG